MVGDEAALKKRFGMLVKAARNRIGLTQLQLANRTHISRDMIAKIENGTTGTRFPRIAALAFALNVDPGELFMVPGHSGIENVELNNITAKLALLPPAQLKWVSGVIDSALKSKP